MTQRVTHTEIKTKRNTAKDRHRYKHKERDTQRTTETK